MTQAERNTEKRLTCAESSVARWVNENADEITTALRHAGELDLCDELRGLLHEWRNASQAYLMNQCEQEESAPGPHKCDAEAESETGDALCSVCGGRWYLPVTPPVPLNYDGKPCDLTREVTQRI
jgi:hypothetical protein